METLVRTPRANVGIEDDFSLSIESTKAVSDLTASRKPRKNCTKTLRGHDLHRVGDIRIGYGWASAPSCVGLARSLPMNAIPRWLPSMSVRDPVLDAQHIELLEICRTVQEMVKYGRQKSDLCALRLEEISHMLREHDRLEACTLMARGEHLPPELHVNRANARQQLDELKTAAALHEISQTRFHSLLCGWIKYHLH